MEIKLMRYVIVFIVIFYFPLGDAKGQEQEQLRSAVAVGFEHGLHSKYLAYIAAKLEMELVLQPLSLSRRLRALQAGHIDLLVGLQNRAAQPEDLIFISPAYQTLASTFFVRTDDANRVNDFTALTRLKIAVTPNISYFSKFDQASNITKVEVDSLQQKIKLLVNNRVDAFIHNRDSTAVNLKLMDLTQEVAPANFQPIEKRNYYFAISTKSKLYPQLDKLTAVIEKGVRSGDFADIRKLHYIELAQAKASERRVTAEAVVVNL